MEELVSLRKDIRGETRNFPPTVEKRKMPRRKERNVDYPPLTRQRSREEQRDNTAREVTWSAIVAKGNTSNTMKRGQAAKIKETGRTVSKQQEQQQQRSRQRSAAEGRGVTIPSSTKKRRVPRTAALVLTYPPGQYEEAMKEAKSKIDLTQCGIEKGKGPNIKRALTGALTFEFAGPEGHAQADKVAGKLKELFRDRAGIRITRPIKMAEMRIKDLEDSIKPDEIKYIVTQEGDCHHEDVKVGAIRRGNNGLGVAWIQCPLSAANRIVAKGKILIGWTNARVMLLDPRLLQCFRCLEGGHVRDQSKSNTDRSKRCYRCGKEGHKARECEDIPRCPVCADLGRLANHRAGNKACTSARMRKRTGSQSRPMKTVTQETPKAVEITTNREETSTVEMTDMTEEQPKPQRVSSRLTRRREIELVDRPVTEMLPQQQREEKSQDTRDREQRAVKALKSSRKVTRRHTDSENEEESCEPEDSRHGERKE